MFKKITNRCCYTCKSIYRDGDIFVCDLELAVNKDMNVRTKLNEKVDYVKGWIGITKVDAIFSVCDSWGLSKDQFPMRTKQEMIDNE